jgi:uncharacterized protein YkwD
MPLILGLAVLSLAGAAGGGYFLWGRPRPAPPAEKAAEPDVVVSKPAPSPEKDDPPPQPATAPRPEQPLLDLINTQRRQEGVPELALDEAGSRGCREHAEYLARHLDRPLLDPHDQEDLPGATAAGKEAARAASVAPAEPREALRAWLTSPAHRALILAPELASVAVGSAKTPDGKWLSVFDFTRGAAAAPRRPVDPVAYPARGQAGVPLIFPGNEIPDPLPDAPDKLGGYPVTLTFPPGVAVAGARASLEDEYGQEVPAWFSSPARPANEKFAANQLNTVCLIPRHPLRAGTRYVARAEARVGDRDWSLAWTFTTQPPAEYGRRIYQRALARLNACREGAGLGPVSLDDELSRGALAHARYVALNIDKVRGLRVNDEDKKLEGYTEEGKRAASRSAVRMGGGVGPADALDWIFASVPNRHAVLNPSLKLVGMGAAPQAPRGWVWVTQASAPRREGDGPPAILYPGKDQRDVPLYFGQPAESLLGEPSKAALGFAVTASFFPRHRVTGAAASLSDGSGREVPCWLSTPAKPLPGAGAAAQILLAAKAPLSPATTYTATMSAEVNGAKWSQTWSFTTLDHARFRDQTAEAMVRRVNEARRLTGLGPVSLHEPLSKGCQAHAAYVARNAEHPKVQGLGIHDEDATLPGATKEGSAAGKASLIAILPDPADSVEGWLATLYHRVPLLDPGLKRVGYGQQRHPTRGWVIVMDASRGR